jgi:patatin-like phospholipase domain-containing protein 2
VSNRLTIALTTTKMQSKLISDFKTRKELIDCITCSCFLPGFSSLRIPTFNGRKYLDGGLSNNQPILDQKTITISAFSGDLDISPDDGDRAIKMNLNGAKLNVNKHNFKRFHEALMPLSDEKLTSVFRQGYSDSKTYFERNNILSNLSDSA